MLSVQGQLHFAGSMLFILEGWLEDSSTPLDQNLPPLGWGLGFEKLSVGQLNCQIARSFYFSKGKLKGLRF